MNELPKFKCSPAWFDDVISGRKNFEIRIQDPDKPVNVGDRIILWECETSRAIIIRVTYIFKLKDLDAFYAPCSAWHYYMMDCPMEVWGLEIQEVSD